MKMLSGKEKTWALLDQGWTEVRDEKGKLVYRCKSAVDTFVYSYFENTDGETRKKVTFAAKEKRIVTYNPKLAKKQLAEIEKMASKAAMCCLSKAKKDEYGESAKYVDFVSIGKDG
ncbi:transposase, partial [Dubosiella newyorkensis]